MLADLGLRLQRYPTMFTALQDGIRNLVTGESFYDCSRLQGIPALEVVSRLTQCDFLMAREREDGKVYFTGGVVSLSIKSVRSSDTQSWQTLNRLCTGRFSRFLPAQPKDRQVDGGGSPARPRVQREAAQVC